MEAAIPEGKKALQIYEGHLAALLNARSSLDQLDEIGSTNMKAEPLSASLYSDLVKYITSPVHEAKEALDDQIPRMQIRVRSLWDKARELELELNGWNFSKDLSTMALRNLKANKEAIEAELIVAGEAFRPIRRMPDEAWVAIFSFVIEETISYQISATRNWQLRLPFLSLSQVCRTWREIVFNEPNISNMA